MKNIEWNKVTWYSILVAIVVFVGSFGLGFYLGEQSEKVKELTPVETMPVSIGNLKTYTEQAGTYSFNYNPGFSVMDGDKTLSTTDWKLNSNTTTGVILSVLTVPKSFMPSTNFSEAKLTIGRSSDREAVKNCTVLSAGEKAVGNVAINGLTFEKVASSDAGAGNFYDTTSYRAVLDGDCYAIEYTIHSTNIGNYPPELGIKEFDKAKVVNELESIIESLHFQLASN